ncbi:helix-turn-helix domain-containing protein [Azospirillum sp. TSA2s]|uniref:helix-turn-helix domain-containing protein n=1 Tax=Azospirillum sp. TSA2s TaxID=709810 RepID=UPI003526D017
MSQEKLGEAIGLTFQQVQKYERGSNRISAGTLYRLGQVLDVPVSFFFDTYNDAGGLRRSRGGFQESDDDDTQISRREARLLRLWRAAPSHVSDEMLSLLSALSPEIKEPPEGPDEGEDGDPGSSTSQDPMQSSNGGSSLAGSEIVAAAPERESARKASRTLRSDAPRVKPVKSADGSSESKARRRHGAVWDPTDILRATKPSPRS